MSHEKFIATIVRIGSQPNRHVVCIKCFQKEDVISIDKLKDANGLEHTQHHCMVLKPDAYPTVLSRLLS